MKIICSIIKWLGLCMIIGFILMCGKRPTDKIDIFFDWKPGADFTGYYVAQEKGFYKNRNLEVNLLPGKGAETTAKLVGEGKYKIGTCNANATIIAKSKGIPIVSVAVLDQAPVTVIFSISEKEIKEPKDLIGKTIGVRYYDISHQEYKVMMAKQKLDVSKVKEISIDWAPQPLLTGHVDAMYSYIYGLAAQLEAKGIKLNKIYVKDWGVKGYGSNIIVNEGFMREKPDIVKRFVEGAIEGWKYSKENPEEAIDIVVKLYPEVDKLGGLTQLKEQIKVLESVATKKFGLGWQTNEGWEETQDNLYQGGIIKEKIKISSLFTTEFLP